MANARPLDSNDFEQQLEEQEMAEFDALLSKPASLEANKGSSGDSAAAATLALSREARQLPCNLKVDCAPDVEKHSGQPNVYQGLQEWFDQNYREMLREMKDRK